MKSLKGIIIKYLCTGTCFFRTRQNLRNLKQAFLYNFLHFKALFSMQWVTVPGALIFGARAKLKEDTVKVTK